MVSICALDSSPVDMTLSSATSVFCSLIIHSLIAFRLLNRSPPSRERNVSAQYIVRNSGLTIVIVTGTVAAHEKSSALRVREILSSEGNFRVIEASETRMLLGVRIVMQHLSHLAS